jgi:filamentous hemagglutinin
MRLRPVLQAPRRHALGAALLAASVWLPALAQTRPPVVFASPSRPPAAPLPQPARNFVADPSLAGRVSWSVNGNKATFNQGTVDRIVLNWDRFDIGAGYHVDFVQNPDRTRYVSALNRVFSADPSVILGRLTANREVILVNPNGVYFGPGARVDTGKFVASTLALADAQFEQGIRNVTNGSAVFAGAANLDAAISVAPGAEIRSAAGGDVLLIAPRVVNAGTISTPEGQTVLAAGERVYLMSSSDPRQRGLIVAADPVLLTGTTTPDPTLGRAENLAQGIDRMQADSGSVNLVGLVVRQAGQVNATTAVRGANGTVFLQSMASTMPLQGGPDPNRQASLRGLTTDTGSTVRVGEQLGTVELAAGSVTQVSPSSSDATQIDAEAFNSSRIRVEGRAIVVGEGASILAPSGRVELLAAASAGSPTNQSPLFNLGLTTPPLADDSRIVIAPNARISVAGVSGVAVDGARNQGAQRLFRIELADAPVQRDGPLYRQEVQFDRREAAGVALANVKGNVASVGRTAQERSTPGGELRIEAQGAVVLAPGAQLDVSGGSVSYSPTTIQNTLLDIDGNAVFFSRAAAGNRVDALLGTAGTRVPAYSEGAAGGALTVSAPRVVLDGDLKGSVVQGPRQRDGTSAAAAPARLVNGRLTDFWVDTLRLDGRAVAPSSAATSLLQDPVGAAVNSIGNALTLSLGALQQSEFGSVTLRARHIEVISPGELTLGVGGRLELQAERVDLAGRFTAPGGAINVSTIRSAPGTAGNLGDITLAEGTRLDVAGLWTNDTAAGNGQLAPVALAGGSVTLAAARSLLVAPGAAIHVSAGAWLSSAGALRRGPAGAASLGVGTAPEVTPNLSLDLGSVSGWGFDAGASLVLVAPTTVVARSGAAPAGGYRFDPELAAAQGFGTVRLSAQGDVTVPAGQALAPVLQRWQLTDAWRAADSGAMSGAVAVPRPTDPQLAEPRAIDLTLAAARPLNRSQPGGSLVVEPGASVTLQPGGRLMLRATRNLSVGTGAGGSPSVLTARGGQITLAIDGIRGGSDDAVGFVPDQALWLGPAAQLDVSGIAQLRPDPAAPSFTRFSPGASATPADQRQVGTVRGGGTITLEAQRGYVVTEAGSRMQLDGAVAQLNLAGLPDAVTLARSAGELVLLSPEGWALEGMVSARAPQGADGGRLRLDLASGGTSPSSVPGAVPYPGDTGTPKPRTVLLADNATRLGSLAPGMALPATLDNGLGHTPSSLLTGSGFAGLSVGAGDAIEWQRSTSLQLPLGAALNAPALRALPGVQVEIAAGRATLGDRSNRIATAQDTGARPDASANKDTQFSVRAPTIEVYGRSALQGFTLTELNAGDQPGGEVRFFATASDQVSGRQGSLAFAGQLTLAGSVVYSSSGTLFTLAGLPAGGASDAGSQLLVETGAGGSATLPPLSALGSLTARATQIEQGGVLWQPFGAITLDAERQLTLRPGSLTSVSGAGGSVLYGNTTNLAIWSLPNGASAETLPLEKRVTLKAPIVQAQAGATVSAAGGGEVLASEFFSGVGGSVDTFDRPDLWAVLPDRKDSEALNLGGVALDAAQQGRQLVITQAGSGLPPGRYQLLPARYAFLGEGLPSGAYLVSRAEGTVSTVQRMPVDRDDGSVVVTGFLTTTGAVAAGTPGERFVVEPLATAQARSEVRLTAISDFIDRAAALNGATVPPARPRDAGRVQVEVSGTAGAVWNASLALQGGGGRAGSLDVAADRVALAADAAGASRAASAGAVALTADRLSASGAGSVLLGAVRSGAGTTEDGRAVERIDASGTRSVTVDVGPAGLVTEELLLAARERVEVAADSRLAAPAQGSLAPRRLQAAGDGALLVLSANTVELQRSGVSPSGPTARLTVAAGAALEAPQLGLDSSGTLTIDASASLLAPALQLGAGRLVLGDALAPKPGDSTIVGALLGRVQAADSLSLRGYGGLEWAGAFDWTRDSRQALLIDTPALLGSSGADVRIAAQQVRLQNSTGLTATATAGGGRIELQAQPALRYGSTGGLTLGPGEVSLGFAQTRLSSTGDMLVQGNGSTRVQGDLRLEAARLTALGNANQALQSTGELSLTRPADSRTLGERTGQGGTLLLSASRIEQQGRIELPGGQLVLQAQGAAGSPRPAVTLGAGSVTSVAGFALQGTAGAPAYADPGSVLVEAAQGAIEALGSLNASAAPQGDAGRITLRAAGPDGTLLLTGTNAAGATERGQLLGAPGNALGDRGGQLTVDTTRLANADALALAAAAGGLDDRVALRVRTGDVVLTEALRARQVSIAADGGSLDLRGPIDAQAQAGGVVTLAARDDLRLAATARIDARSSETGANGGDVLLASRAGRVRLAPGAEVDAGGDSSSDGRIVLRAARLGDTAVAVDALDTAALKAGEVGIEAVRRYETVTVGSTTRNINVLAAGNDSVGTTAAPTGTLGLNSVRRDNDRFMANAATVGAALGLDAADAGRVWLRPGVEVAAPGALTLSGTTQVSPPAQAAPVWLFNERVDRPGGAGATLTLRAGADITLNTSISDGFAGGTATAPIGSVLGSNSTPDWSFRIAAGADLSAADPLALQAGASGNLVLGAGRVLRTGTGSIELAAAGDIRFTAGSGNTPAAQAYVAGRAIDGQAALLASLFPQTAKPAFTDRGGRVSLVAGRDIVAPESTQLAPNWLWRSGLVPTGTSGLYATGSQLAWWSEFSAFRQALGAFGGGNLQLQAGRDLLNVQAVAPGIGWADSRDPATAQIVRLGAGELTAFAGRHVLGGQYLVGDGDGRLRADGDIGELASNRRLDSALLATGGGSWRVGASGGLQIGGAYNPTAAPVPTEFGRVNVSGVFYTWGSDTALDLRAGADLRVQIGPASGTLASDFALGPLPSQGPTLLSVLPPSLRASAATGDLVLLPGGSPTAVMFPSATGSLSLWAGRDLRGGSANTQLAMADSDPAAWPGARNPVAASSSGQALVTGNLLAATLSDQRPLGTLHASSDEVVRFHAERQLALASDVATNSALLVPLPAHVSAGQDIVGLSLRSQHVDAGDETTVTAGRNLSLSLNNRIEVAGPGRLVVQAGAELDLGASVGLLTSGNTRNAALPTGGASIRVQAASAGVTDLAQLRLRYLSPPQAGGSPLWQQHRDALVVTVRQALASPTLGYEAALEQFERFPAAAQQAYTQELLAREFSATYLTSAAPTVAQWREALGTAFTQRQADVLAAADAALAAGGSLELPGRVQLKGDDLKRYADGLRALRLADIALGDLPERRAADQAAIIQGWQAAVARSQGRSVAELQALPANDPARVAWQQGLLATSGPVFERYREHVVQRESDAAAAAAAGFGRQVLPLRLALFDDAFEVLELGGQGSFVPQPVWPGWTPLLARSGALNLTQSAIVTQRGGDIALLNPAGAITVGLKDVPANDGRTRGVIARGGGNVFGLARDDFQVNTQRVFIVGEGNMSILTALGDIDSGRGANTAVGTPPLAARRSADGVVFEVPATTTGSGLGIVPDQQGRAVGTIGLYPAFGEILALDAFIRAPSIVLGSSVRGADGVSGGTVSGAAAAPVAAPPAVSTPPPSSEPRSTASTAPAETAAARERNSLLTVELLGIGPGEPCEGLTGAELDACRRRPAEPPPRARP